MAVEVIATIKPKNNGKFPIVEAADVDVNGTPLNEALEGIGNGNTDERTSPPTITREGTVVTMSVTPEQMDDAFGVMDLGYRVCNRLDNNNDTNHTNYLIRNIKASTPYTVDITEDDVYDEDIKGEYCVEAYAIALGRTKSNPAISETYEFQKYEPLYEAYNLCFMNTEFITFPLDIAKVVDINDWNEALLNIPIILGAPASGYEIEDRATHIGFEIDGNTLYIRDLDKDTVICTVVDGVPEWRIDCSEWFILPHEQEVPLSFAIWFRDNYVSTLAYYDVSNMAFEFYEGVTDFGDGIGFPRISAPFTDTLGKQYYSIKIREDYVGEDGIQRDTIFYDDEPMTSRRITFGDNAYIPYDTDKYGWFWQNGALSEAPPEEEFVEATPVQSSFDNDGDGFAEIYLFSKELTEKFKTEDTIRIDAVKDITNDSGVHQEANSHYMKYDDGILPPHVYCYDNSSANYLRYSFNVAEDGIYELAVHLRIKDEQLRGATYTINRGTKYEHSFVTTYGWASEEEALAMRNNDELQGAYMSGMLVHLRKGVNTIHITNAVGVTKNQHFRNLYLIKTDELCYHATTNTGFCLSCGTDFGLTMDEAEAKGVVLAKGAKLPDYYDITVTFNNGAPRFTDGFCRVKTSNGNLMSIHKITLKTSPNNMQTMPLANDTVILRGKIGCVNSTVNGSIGKEARIFDATII